MKQVDYTLSSELKKILSDKKINNNLDNITNTLKITLIYKDITQIGEYIPYQFQGVTHLLLSNNKISNLNGIQQFPNLTHFSISFNYIEDI
jgi:Leucine-rich repeat (LRR) protein